jgi:hypothetical protein
MLHEIEKIEANVKFLSNRACDLVRRFHQDSTPFLQFHFTNLEMYFFFPFSHLQLRKPLNLI